ncbi:MAG: hypothetical protein OER86_00755 [Phycisphaerae bacterium]|nr:hypothetical protein [Phycisphaerae bacterium]
MLRLMTTTCVLAALMVGGCSDDAPVPTPATGGALDPLSKKASEGGKAIEAAAKTTGETLKTGAADASEALGDSAAKTVDQLKDQASTKTTELIDAAKKTVDPATSDGKVTDAVDAAKKTATDAAEKAGEDPAKKAIDALQPDKDLKFGK